MRLIYLVFFVLSASFTNAQSVQSAIDALLKIPALKHASVSIHFQDMKTRETVGQHQKDLSLIPASSLKIITTGVALEKLGKDFTYQTKLYSSAGNIYIQGSGDPTLGSPQSDYTVNTEAIIDKFVSAIAEDGIQHLSGGVLGISDVFDTSVVGDSWPWYDLGNYYAGGVWGLNIRENYYDLFLDQNPKPGTAPQCCGTDPEIPGLQFINELTSGSISSGDNAYIYGAPYSYQKFIRGTIPAGSSTFKIKGSIPEPPLLTAQLLHKALVMKNIAVTQAAAYTFKSHNLSEAKLLATHNSPSLLSIITDTNRESINLYAEALLKSLGLQEKGKPGTTENGLEVIYDHFKNYSINTDGFYMVDGSGMSPRNGISSKHFTGFLQSMFQSLDLYQDFKSSLAVIGRQGTLQYMMQQSPIAGHLFGKSGSMKRVRSYTGYIETMSGKTIAFSIIINNYAGKSRPVVKAIETIFTQVHAL